MQAKAVIDRDGIVTCSGLAGPVPWWSVSKTVLSIASLRLVEQGALNLDGTLDGERFSLRHLLRHEAGLTDYGTLESYHADVAAERPPWPVPRLLAAVDAGELLYPPGTGWAYSNIGYLKVAQLIEKASGTTLAAALDRLVFRPAGLHSARLALQPEDLAAVQMGSADRYHPGWVYHGLVVGTVADAARLLWTLVTGRVLPAAMLTQMMGGRSLPEHRSVLHPDAAYGLGLMLSGDRPEEHPIGHGGAGPGSRIAAYASDGRAAAVWAATGCGRDVEEQTLRLLQD